MNSQASDAPFFQPRPVVNNGDEGYERNAITALVPNGDKTETKEEAPSETVAPTEITAITTATCNPTGVSYADFLKATGNIDDAFGVTTVDSNHVTFPDVVLKGGVLQKTTAGMQVSSFYLQAQTFKDKGVVILQDDAGGENNYCMHGKYERYWEITQRGADKVKEGEQEHCNDFMMAFDLTLAKYRDAVNSTAGKKFASDAAAKAYLQKQTKVHPDKWQSTFWCLAGKTRDRDKMNWHLPKNINPRINKTCDKAILRLWDTNLPEIGKHPSAEIINGCDGKK